MWLYIAHFWGALYSRLIVIPHPLRHGTTIICSSLKRIQMVDRKQGINKRSKALVYTPVWNIMHKCSNHIQHKDEA